MQTRNFSPTSPQFGQGTLKTAVDQTATFYKGEDRHSTMNHTQAALKISAGRAMNSSEAINIPTIIIYQREAHRPTMHHAQLVLRI